MATLSKLVKPIKKLDRDFALIDLCAQVVMHYNRHSHTYKRSVCYPKVRGYQINNKLFLRTNSNNEAFCLPFHLNCDSVFNLLHNHNGIPSLKTFSIKARQALATLHNARFE